MLSVKLESDVDSSTKPKRSKYSEGFSPQDFKLSSVKKLFILAVTCATETYKNVKAILETLGLEAVEFGYSLDLKMALILGGKQTAACRHCCPYCDGRMPWLTPGNPATIGSLWKSFDSFTASVGDRAKAKEYGNVVNPPLVTGHDAAKIIDFFNPPELHLMTGCVGKIIKELERKVFATQEEGKVFMDKYLKE